MHIKSLFLLAYLAYLAVLTACSDRNAISNGITVAASSGTASVVRTDMWLGQWNGPEGTFLRLDGGKGKYKVTIQNLDGPLSYQGSSVGDAIQFERNGVMETIQPTNGAQTGMKWLAEKTNCLTVHVGEGYCRD